MPNKTKTNELTKTKRTRTVRPLITQIQERISKVREDLATVATWTGADDADKKANAAAESLAFVLDVLKALEGEGFVPPKPGRRELAQGDKVQIKSATRAAFGVTYSNAYGGAAPTSYIFVRRDPMTPSLCVLCVLDVEHDRGAPRRTVLARFRQIERVPS